MHNYKATDTTIHLNKGESYTPRIKPVDKHGSVSKSERSVQNCWAWLTNEEKRKLGNRCCIIFAPFLDLLG